MKKLILLAVLITAGCDQPMPGGNPVNGSSLIQKVCDHGRAIYMYNSARTGGIYVIDKAPECPLM